MHTWTAKNRMQYSASQVASMAVLLFQNVLRSNLRTSNFLKISWGSMPPDPPSYACLCKLHIHVTPLLKILPMGLIYQLYMAKLTS